MFSHSTAARRDDLPVSPGPTHVYIEFAVDLIDGIPTTAGASVSGLKIPSPVKVSDPLVITGFAPANSQCRVVVFLPKKVVSLPPPRQPELDGTVKWELTLTPEAAGSRLSIHVHCVEIRGTKFLENVTRGSADINP